MDVKTRQLGNVALVVPAGRVDQSTSAQFEAALSPLWGRADVAALMLDFAGVEYISSVGLRVLMIASRQMRARHGRILIAGLQPIVAEIFTISRFDKVLEVFPTVRDALAAISHEALSAYDAS